MHQAPRFVHLATKTKYDQNPDGSRRLSDEHPNSPFSPFCGLRFRVKLSNTALFMPRLLGEPLQDRAV